MIVSPGDWKNATWRVSIRLEAPELSPCAVVCAILDHDPTAGFEGELPRPGSAVRAGAEQGQSRLAALEGAWNSRFRAVTGDKLYLVTDFTEGPRDIGDSEENRSPTSKVVTVTSAEVEGRRWLASRALRVGARLVCWSIPFQARRGHSTEIVLRGTNLVELGAVTEP